MAIGQLIKNTETGRLGMIKSVLAEGRAVVTRCNEQGMPTKDTRKTLWGTAKGPGIWITLLDKWEPVATQQPPARQMFLFT